MNKYNKLISNSLIFTIGNMGSKLINLLMVPLYTHVLSTDDYGLVELITTTTALLVPVLTLALGHAALRFAIEANSELSRNEIFGNITFHGLAVTIFLAVVVSIVQLLNLFQNNATLFLILLTLQLFNDLYSQFARGIGLVKVYAINGVLMTIVTVLSNLLLLVILDFKVEGYLYSLILSYLISTLFLFTMVKGWSRLKYLKFNQKLQESMLKYSIPIIPNTAMWWIISGSTRYFLLYFVGSSANGLFAVANKIPSIISMITGIFSQAWQLSSFEEYNSKDKDAFYSRIFSIYWLFLFIIGSGILIILKPMIFVLIDESFHLSWRIVPLLILSVIYQSFSTFLGTNYTASKETKGTFTTSVYAGLISLISSIIFIPLLGSIGAGLSSALSFFIMFVLRLFDTRKFVIININIKKFIISNLIFLFQTGALFIFNNLVLVIIQIILFNLLLIVNSKELLILVKTLLGKNNSI